MNPEHAAIEALSEAHVFIVKHGNLEESRELRLKIQQAYREMTLKYGLPLSEAKPIEHPQRKARKL